MENIFLYNQSGDTIIGLTDFGNSLKNIEIPVQNEGGGVYNNYW